MSLILLQPPKVLNPAAVKGTMPENLETLHPVTVVGRLYPGTLFTEISREGTPPNLTFCMGASVEGVQYTGTGKYPLILCLEISEYCIFNILFF